MTQVIRWEAQQAPTEHELRQRLAYEGLRPYSWNNSAGDRYPVHRHNYHKVIYVVRGSISLGLPEQGQLIELKPGDRLELPAGIAHDAVVGPEGVECLEAHH